MNRKIRIGIVVVVVLAVVGTLLWFFLGRKADAGTDAVAYVSTVGSITGADQGIINKFAGVVEPQKTIDIKLEQNRTIADVKVNVGDEVDVGTPLFEYDTSTSQDELMQAQLDLESLQNEAVSLQSQLATLQAEKAKAEQSVQLEYTIQIQTAEMDIKKNEYDQKSKAASITKLEQASQNAVVVSEVKGTVKSINQTQTGDGSDISSDYNSGGSDSSAFMTILSTGTFRIKGQVNEQNMSSIVEGTPVIVHSRVDSEQTWKGTLTSVDMDNPITNTNYMYDSGDSSANSSSYPFYVDLESSDQLMLGQHVYIETDNGQEEQKEGIWLSEMYIMDPDTDPYVWASDSKDTLVKQKITLGSYDESLGEYEITEGLTLKDCIAFPEESLTEGMTTQINEASQEPISVEGEEGAVLPEGEEVLTEEGNTGVEVYSDSAVSDQEADAALQEQE
ncbi:MAG: efflux RND transporter periplasmic adaptor subunit [Lachnospiraceae bacterium]